MKIFKTFTLIELILVVAIVAVLAGVMIPTITSARQKARAAKIVQMADTFRHACTMFTSDTGRYALERGDFPSSIRDLSVGRAWISGWDGPYLEKRLEKKDAFPAKWIWVNDRMVRDFDLDGDGTVDKFFLTPGNSIFLQLISESDAKSINDLMDINIPGDWRNTGKVVYWPWGPGAAAGIYLIGGS